MQIIHNVFKCVPTLNKLSRYPNEMQINPFVSMAYHIILLRHPASAYNFLQMYIVNGCGAPLLCECTLFHIYLKCAHILRYWNAANIGHSVRRRIWRMFVFGCRASTFIESVHNHCLGVLFGLRVVENLFIISWRFAWLKQFREQFVEDMKEARFALRVVMWRVFVGEMR